MIGMDEGEWCAVAEAGVWRRGTIGRRRGGIGGRRSDALMRGGGEGCGAEMGGPLTVP